MQTNRPWENRVARMMRRAGQRVRRERAVFVRAAIDFHLGVVTHNEFFGPLLPALVGRRVVVEHYSTAPDAASVERALLKALALQVRSAPSKPSRQTPTVDPPVDVTLVVLCRESIGACKRLPLVAHPSEAGWWTLQQVRVQVHVLAARQLNPDGRWGVLRVALAVHDDPEQQIAELLADPGASILTKRRLMEDIMNKRVETTPPERKISFATAFDRSFREGRKEGRVEGREEGRVEGREEGRVEGRREALLDMARPLGLPVDDLAELKDLGELQRRVFDAIKARD